MKHWSLKIGWTSKVSLNGYYSWIDHTRVSSSPLNSLGGVYPWVCV